MEKNSGQFFNELKKDVVTYAELKLELLKLGTYERIGKVISILSYGIILMALALFMFLFLFLALGFFLSNRLHSLSAGFTVIAALSLFLLGGVAFLRKQICTYILNLVIATLTANDKKHRTTDDTIPTGETTG